MLGVWPQPPNNLKLKGSEQQNKASYSNTPLKLCALYQTEEKNVSSLACEE